MSMGEEAEMKKKAIIIFIIFFVCVVSCGLIPAKLEAIEIDGPETVDINQTIQFKIKTTPSQAEADIEWNSSDNDIAIVDDEGYVTGIAEGEAIITAASVDYPEITDSIEITVTKPIVESIEIHGPEQVYVNAKISLSAVITPSYIDQSVAYISSDQRVAKVDSTGTVTGVAPGTVTIVAISNYDSTAYATREITVLAKEITGFTISGKGELYVKTTAQFSAVAEGNIIDDLVEWSSTVPEVATVDSSGLVRAVSAGTATIRAVLKDNPEVFAETEVEVLHRDKLYYHTKILSIDRNERQIELLNVPYTEYDAGIRILRKAGDAVEAAGLDDLHIGMENVYAEVDIATEVISAILIDGETGFSNIRVGIRYSIDNIADNATLYHSAVTLTLLSDARLQTFDGEKSVGLLRNQTVTVTMNNGKIVVKRGSEIVLETRKRIIFIPASSDDAIKITSIKRGSNTTYAGNVEISLFNDKLLVVNDINLEQYLYKVVPSEMPASYNDEALKAQAIAARTYAYADIFNRANENKGYTVDDSISSQVYNNKNANSKTTAAVNATRGMVMMNEGKLISAFYYSTSSGLTASAHEVWISDGFSYPAPTSYLIGQNLTEDASGNPITFDYRDEASMLSFFKTIKMTTPDSHTNHHRWRVTFTKEQLSATINANLRLTYQSSPNLVLTETVAGWESLSIPESVGEVLDVYVDERGASGVVISLIVETTTGKYKIINQYNIRFTIRPKDSGGTVTRYYAQGTDNDYSGHKENDSILLSGFFAIERNGDDYTFYGGGNGHGVGMSQNGANGYAGRGYDYEQILTTYYQAIDLVDISYEYQPLVEYEGYFKLS